MQGRKLSHKIASFPAGKLPVEYLIHKKPFKCLVFCASVKCTITGKKQRREIMTGKLSIQQLAGKFLFQIQHIWQAGLWNTHISWHLYWKSEECSGNKYNLLYSVRAQYLFFSPIFIVFYVQPNHPFLTSCYYFLNPS